MPSDPSEQLPLKNLDSLLRQTMKNLSSSRVIDWRRLTDPGENFGSLILAIDALITTNDDKINENELHLVCKMPPKSEYLLDLFNSPMAFSKELYFYTVIAPAFIRLQKNNGFADNELIDLAPRFYGGRLSLDNNNNNEKTFDDQAAIILENLNYSGYTTKDRITGMDYDHVSYGVKELAKLHAITCGLRVKEPDYYAKVIAPGLKPAYNDTAGKCIGEMVKKAMDNLKTMKEAGPYIERALRTLQYHERCISEGDANRTKIERWCTFVHGDYWVNNAMYRYDKNDPKKITGMKIVDFQLSVSDYGMNDLIFFLVSSAQIEIIDEKLDDLVDLYYVTFVNTLNGLNVDTTINYERDEFDRLFKECAPLKFAQCIMMVQVIKATRGTAPDVNSIKNEEAFLSIGKGKLYEEKLLHVLQTFVKNDWLVD